MELQVKAEIITWVSLAYKYYVKPWGWMSSSRERKYGVARTKPWGTRGWAQEEETAKQIEKVGGESHRWYPERYVARDRNATT